MSPLSVPFSLNLVPLAPGEFAARATDLTGLLRHLADYWVHAAGDGTTDLDPGTVEALAGALGDLADQVDVACIDAAGTETGDDR